MHRVLIIGCGRIAGGFDAGSADGGPVRTHAAAFGAHGRFALTGCVDPDGAARNAFAARWGVTRSAASAAEFSPGSFDVVAICSPTDLHAEHIEQALALRPRLVFCEKPVTGDAARTAALVARCAAEGVLLAVNYTRRWAPDVVALAHELRSGRWGAVRSAAGIYTKGVVHNGGHMIDLLHVLLGPVELAATGAPAFDFWPDDPSVPALLYAGEVPVQLSVGDAGDYAVFELALVTEQGEVAMRDGGLSWTVRRAIPSPDFAGYTSLGAFEHRPGRYDEAMTVAVANIAAALEEGDPLASTGETALAAQRVCEQMRDASTSSQRTHR